MTTGSSSSSTEEMLQGQVELWHHALGYVRSMALKCALDLAIPDAIHRCGGAATLPDILAATNLPSCNLPYLRRLMRVLTVSRVFALKPTELGEAEDAAVESTYTLTAASRLLVTGSAQPFGQSPCMQFVVDPSIVSVFSRMHEWIADENAAATSLLQMARGVERWEAVRTEGDLMFNMAMSSDSGLIMRAVLEGSPGVFEGATSLVDVGGGYGTAAAAVARALPHVKCTVLDLPHVVTNPPVNDNLAAAAAAGNAVQFVSGDMFVHIPPADVVMLKWILHSWNDDDCIKILRECKKAIGVGGKVVIIGVVVGSNPGDAVRKETESLFDVYMMFVNGIEREEHEWKRIILGAGFSGYKITPILGFRSIIEAC